MPVRSFAALGASVCICVCALPLCAQAPRDAESAATRARVLVRDLSIPDSARRNYAKSREELIEKRNPECAIGHLRKAIAEYSDYYEAWFLLGVAYMELKQPAEAEAALHKSVSLSAERFAQPLIALATLYSNQSRYADAEPFAAQAVELDDSLWYAHYELARARLQLDRLEEALASARIVLREQPEYAQGRLLLALSHARRHEYSAAIEQLDAYLRLEPDAAARGKVLRLREALARDATVQTTAATSHPD